MVPGGCKGVDELGKNTSVVMITLNEEASVEPVVKDIKRVLPEAEIVIVDSSTDRTAEIAQELGCNVVKQFPPQGYGNAMHKAFESANRDYVVTLDCDSTYPVDAIPKLFQTMKAQNADIVSASRLPKKPDTMPLANYIANVGFCWLGLLFCGIWTTDLHTGMRLYKREVLRNYPYDPSYGALPVELQLGPMMTGYKCVEIFIDYHERAGVSKLQRWKGTVTTLQRIWRCRWFANGFRSEQAKVQHAKREAALISPGGAPPAEAH
jgi:glycosyltransferase involved in cell wall biosynthesis